MPSCAGPASVSAPQTPRAQPGPHECFARAFAAVAATPPRGCALGCVGATDPPTSSPREPAPPSATSRAGQGRAHAPWLSVLDAAEVRCGDAPPLAAPLALALHPSLPFLLPLALPRRPRPARLQEENPPHVAPSSPPSTHHAPRSCARRRH